jgi:hypothetical protein
VGERKTASDKGSGTTRMMITTGQITISVEIALVSLFSILLLSSVNDISLIQSYGSEICNSACASLMQIQEPNSTKIPALLPSSENATSVTFSLIGHNNNNNSTSTFTATSTTSGSGNETSPSPPLKVISPPPRNETGMKAPPLFPSPSPVNNQTVVPQNPASPSGIHIATLMLSPPNPSPGLLLTISGIGFGARENITLSMDNINNNLLDANSTITTDDNGSFVVITILPADTVTLADHKIMATGNSTGATAYVIVHVGKGVGSP